MVSYEGSLNMSHVGILKVTKVHSHFSKLKNMFEIVAQVNSLLCIFFFRGFSEFLLLTFSCFYNLSRLTVSQTPTIILKKCYVGQN